MLRQQLQQLQQLQHAARAHLVADGTTHGPTAEQPGWHTFRHALTADAIAHRLLPAERAALCLAAADAIESAHASHATESADASERGTGGASRPGEPHGLIGGELVFQPLGLWGEVLDHG